MFLKNLILILISSMLLYSCTTNTAKIEKKIGISIPPHDEITNNSHFLGFDYSEEFECTFDSLDFLTLCQNIENSNLYNFCKIDSFNLLETSIKTNIIKDLKSSSMTGFWVLNNNTYEFYQPTNSLNHFDTTQVNRALNNLILENERLSISDTINLKKFPYIIFDLSTKYYIQAILDKKNKKLTYKLIYV